MEFKSYPSINSGFVVEILVPVPYILSIYLLLVGILWIDLCCLCRTNSKTTKCEYLQRCI